ncbi:MAG: amino acid ABC transporter substrate-binding protein [Deltaproteobacteria bacterium]|nr:amino acid ABC transporter substrate-binding protein [Deltaproteobacteria bacterium]
MISSFARASALMLLLIVAPLTGCPPDDGSVPQAFPTLDESATPTVTVVDDDKLIVRICTILPSSGPSKDVGAEIRRGADIARSAIESSKHTFQWTDKDTKSTEPGAMAAFRACFNEGHHIIIGPVHPAAITALIPVAASHDVVLIIPELGAAVPSTWGPSMAAVAPPATEMGRIAGNSARRARGLRKGAVLHVPKVFGEGLRDAFSKEFLEAEEGGTMVDTRELAPDSPQSWGAAAKELASQGVDALFVVGPPEPSRAVAKAVRGTKTHAWFIDWAMHPPVLDAAAPDARAQVHWVNRALPRGEFEVAYRDRHQAKPEYPAGAGYDAVKLATLAVAGSKSNWHEDISAALRKVDNLPSAFGTAQVVEEGGIVFVDAAGYRLIEPVPLPDTNEWVFGGFE